MILLHNLTKLLADEITDQLARDASSRMNAKKLVKKRIEDNVSLGKHPRPQNLIISKCASDFHCMCHFLLQSTCPQVKQHWFGLTVSETAKRSIDVTQGRRLRQRY